MTDRRDQLPTDDAGRDPHGRTAERPTDLPAPAWRDIAARVRVEAKDDNITLLAAGVAFYALLALVPALVALLSIYSLIADPDDIRDQVVDALRAAPEEVRDLVSDQLESIARSSGGALLGLLVATVVALWSASSGMAQLMAAVNVAYDERETRGFVRKRGTALLFTFGALVFVALGLTCAAVVPRLAEDAGLGRPVRILVRIAAWAVLVVGMMIVLAIVYRYGPDRDEPRWRWTSPGAFIAMVLWLIASVLFSVYTANFGKYNETYGSLGAVVVLMLWLFITALCVMLGAEINAEMERQTAKDTTAGAPRPLGRREAYAADTIGPTADEVSGR